MHQNPKFLIVLLAGAVVIACASPATAQLEMRSVYSAGRATSRVVTADFNRDGIMDMAVGSFEGSSAVQVFLGKGDGTFQPPVAYDPGTGANALATADLNHDGIPDLVIANDVGESVTVLLGKGDGTFQAPLTYATPSVAAAVVLGDFNGDDNLDIVTADQADLTTLCYCVAVLLGNGDGTFQEPAIVTALVTDAYPEALARGYLDGDSNLDLAVGFNAHNEGQLEVLLGNGDGTFRLGQAYTLSGPDPATVVAADLRRNGKTDLTVAVSEGGTIAVLLANGDGTFEQPVEYHTDFSLGVAVGDLNADGIPDLVATGVVENSNGPSGLLYIFPGNGDGTFRSPEIFYPVGSFPRALGLADFNGDHQLDVTLADQDGPSEYILLNTGHVFFSPITPIDFGKQKVGTTSLPQTVTVSNRGNTALAIHSMKTTGQFSATSTCGTSLGSKASCTISVTFSPASTGQKSGTVQINDGASTKAQVVALSGTGD